MGQKCHDIGFGSNFLDMTSKAQATKEKNRQVGLHENFKICAPKDNVNRVKRQPTKWKKIICKLYISCIEILIKV